MSKIVLIFLLLGFIDEYNCRHITEGSNKVESFYGNEASAEKVFESNAAKFLAADKAGSKLKVIHGDDDAKTIENAHLAAKINSYYTGDFSAGMTTEIDGKPHRMKQDCLAESTFAKATEQEKLSYLVGAYIRFGKDSCYSFANNGEKAKLIARLLPQLGATEVKISTTSDSIPAKSQVCFKATGSSSQISALAADLSHQKNDAI